MKEKNESNSTYGISDEELTERFKSSVEIDGKICKIKGLPIAYYDYERNEAYLEYPEGTREMMLDKMIKRSKKNTVNHHFDRKSTNRNKTKFTGKNRSNIHANGT